MGNPGEFGQYSALSPEPIDVIEAWGLPFHEATILQYVVRHPRKGGVEDLRKARFYLDRLITLCEMRGANAPAPTIRAKGDLGGV